MAESPTKKQCPWNKEGDNRGHAGVTGNEIADQWAVDAATRECKSRSGEGTLENPTTTSLHMSRAFLKSRLKRIATTRRREEISRRCKGRRPYHIPREGEVPRIPAGLQRVPKELASHFFQLASGHALIAFP